MNFPSFPWLLHESALNFSTPERHYWCLCFPKSLFGCMATDWQALSVSRLSSCVTGALSSEKTLPPVAGAALHPGADDPGHVYPHITFTGQLSQHQAVHIPMRPTETGFKKKKKYTATPPIFIWLVPSLSHHVPPRRWNSAGTASRTSRGPLRTEPQTGRRMEDDPQGHCRRCETGGLRINRCMWPRPVRMTMTLDVNILHCLLFPAFRFCLRLLGCTATGPILADFSPPAQLVQRLSCCSNCNPVYFVHVSSGPFIVFVIFVSCWFPSLLVGLVQCLSSICKEVKHIPKYFWPESFCFSQQNMGHV